MKFNITIEVPDEYFLIQAALKGGGAVNNPSGDQGVGNGLLGILQNILQNAVVNQNTTASVQNTEQNFSKDNQQEVQKPMSEVDTSALADFLGGLDDD